MPRKSSFPRRIVVVPAVAFLCIPCLVSCDSSFLPSGFAFSRAGQGLCTRGRDPRLAGVDLDRLVCGQQEGRPRWALLDSFGETLRDETIGGVGVYGCVVDLGGGQRFSR